MVESRLGFILPFRFSVMETKSDSTLPLTAAHEWEVKRKDRQENGDRREATHFKPQLYRLNSEQIICYLSLLESILFDMCMDGK